MRIIQARNVGAAYVQGLALLEEVGAVRESRAGTTVVAPWPVMTVYERPWERVLLDERRDANPFFHLFEALWMLAGRDDATWLDQFVSDFSSRFAEEGGRQHGAYGARWRRHLDFDQLDVVVERLRSSPDDRRSVIQMWDATYDLCDPRERDEDTGERVAEPRDVPCNTHLYPRIRQGRDGLALDLTVCCRSNDVIWGAYGANAVHFSVLQEYLAGRIGVLVGRMYQLSNDYHAYTSVLSRFHGGELPVYRGEYERGAVSAYPLGQDWERWDADLLSFMSAPFDTVYANSFFSQVAGPMLWAHRLWRQGDKTGGYESLDMVGAPDWELAARRWMLRRMGS